MQVEVRLFGAMRQFQPDDVLMLDVTDGACIRDVRDAFAAHAAAAQWSPTAASLLGASAFASEQAILRDDDAIPADGRIALLPPVNGG